MFKDTRLASIDRRRFLRGLGSTVIALPFFEFFLDAQKASAQATTAPRRFLVMRMGESPSTDGDTARDLSGRVRNMLTPASYGPDFTLSPGIARLGDYPDLKPYIGVYSNMDLPWLNGSDTPWRDLPPATYYDPGYHNFNGYTYLTGRRCSFSQQGGGFDMGPSADYQLKLSLDPMARLQHINVTAQPGVGGIRGIITRDGAGNELYPNDSPRLFFQNMFSNVQSGPTTMVDPVADLARRQRKSVLDLIDRDRLTFLKRELGAGERAMLSNHLDEIREIERRIDALPVPVTQGSTCQKPMDPGADPARTTVEYLYPGQTETMTISDQGEDQRANTLIDLIAMAFACDISRFGSFRLCGDQPVHFNSHFVTGVNADVHALGHYGGTVNDMMKVVTWSSGKFFRLAEALRTRREGAGNLLDNSALVYVTDGGSDDGVGTEGGQRIARTHSHGNHVVLVAGKAGGLKTNGTHVNMNHRHPGAVLLAAMRSTGYAGNLGDLTQHHTEVLA